MSYPSVIFYYPWDLFSSFAGLAFRVIDSFLLLDFIFLVHESYRPIIIFSVPESNMNCPQIADIVSRVLVIQ